MEVRGVDVLKTTGSNNEIGLKPARQQPRSSRVVGESRDLFMLSVAPTGSILKPKNLT